MREQGEELETNHGGNRAMGKEGETNHRCHKHSPRKRRNGGMPVGYSGRINLMEGAMWHVDPLLGNDRKISSHTKATDR
jgi:hypothetical protein